jgi:hypothetical protein
MIARAYCHQEAAHLWDHRGRRKTIAFRKSVRPDPRRRAARVHSDSECEAGEVIRCWAEDRSIGLAVLPAGFQL